MIPAPPRPAAAAAVDDAGLLSCEQQLSAHLRAVVQRFGSAAAGLVDLPPLGAGLLVAAQVRVAGVLLWCRELERGGLLPVVEALGDALGSGALPIDDPASARRLFRWWRRRNDRFTGPEREAVYTQLVAGGELDAALASVVDALVDLGRMRRDVHPSGARARLGVATTSLGQLLSDRGVGMAAFAARDIVADVRAAVGFLGDPALARVLGGGSPWRIVTRWAPRLLGRTVRLHSSLTRARAVVEIASWIADNAGDLHTAAVRVGRGHPLVAAAEAWRASGRGAA